MTDEQDRWMEYAEFRGETIEAMKAIQRELKEIKICQRELANNFSNHRISYNNMRIRMASIAGAVSVITSLIVIIVGKLI